MEKIIEIDNYEIFVKVEGAGPPLLLLHSYWGSLILFDRLTGELSGKMKVIRIDLPGHGSSGNPPIGYHFDQFAYILNELLEKLNITGKISIIGHSMGGYVALAFVARFPEKTASLVLMHSPVRNADTQSIKLRNREAALLKSGKKELLLQLTIPSNFAQGQTNEMKEMITTLNQTAYQVSLDGALRTIEAMNSRTNYLQMLQEAQYPILIIIGKYDKVYKATGQLDDAILIPKAEVLLLENSGHLGFLEEEEKVLIRLKEFLMLSEKT